MKIKFTSLTVASLAVLALGTGGYAASYLSEKAPDDALRNKAKDMESQDFSFIQNGVAQISTVEQWNALPSAMEKDVQLTAIEFMQDIEWTLATTGPSTECLKGEINIPIRGNGHTFGCVTSPLVEKLGPNGSITELMVVVDEGSFAFDSCSVNGVLANINVGTIEDCVVSARELTCDMFVWFNANLKGSPIYTDAFTAGGVGVGALVGANAGTIRRCYAGFRNFILVGDGGDRTNAAPSHVSIGGLVAYNASNGIVEDVVLDMASDGDPSNTLMDVFQINSNSNQRQLTYGKVEAEAPDFQWGLAVGRNKGTVKNVILPFHADNIEVNEPVSLKCAIDGEGEFPVSVLTKVDESSYAHSQPSPFVAKTDLTTCFGDNASKWGFTPSDMWTELRAPIPAIFGAELVLGELVINRGVAKVSGYTSFSELRLALLDGLEINSVELTNDIDVEKGNSIDYLDIPLDGKGHTISGLSLPLVNTLGPNGSISNLCIETYNANPTSNNFGLFANVNEGVIEYCAVKVLDGFNYGLADVLWQMEYEGNAGEQITAGLFVGHNKGTISSSYVGTPSFGINSNDGYVINGSIPSSIYLGGLVGYNAEQGNIVDVVLDVTPGGISEPSSFFFQGSNVTIVDPEVTDTSRVDVQLGFLIGKNDGNVVNAYRSKSDYAYTQASASGSYGGYGDYGGDTQVSGFRLFITPEETSSSKFEQTVNYTGYEWDMFEQKSVSRDKYATLFQSDAKLWGSTYAKKDYEKSYRTPIPVPFDGVPEYSSNLRVEDGVIFISDIEQWNNDLYTALDEYRGTGRLKKILLLNDLDYSSSDYDVSDFCLSEGIVFDGNGHTLYGFGKAFVDTLGANCVIRNLTVSGNGGVDYSNNYGNSGLIANVNNGTIEFCNVIGCTKKAGFDDLMYSGNGTTAAGGIAGLNNGVITNCRVEDLTLTCDNGKASGVNSANVSFNAGLIAGVNSKEALIDECVVYPKSVSPFDINATFSIVQYEGDPQISSVDCNLGLTAGKNEGKIGNVFTLRFLDPTIGSDLDYKANVSFVREVSDGGVTTAATATFSDINWQAADGNIKLIKTVEAMPGEASSYVNASQWASDEALADFKQPAMWTMNCPMNGYESQNIARYPIPRLCATAVETEFDNATHELLVNIPDSAGLIGAFGLLADANTDFFGDVKVDFADSLVFNTSDIPMDMVIDEKDGYFNVLPTVPTFTGSVNGGVVRNGMFSVQGPLFGTISKSAVIDRLVFDGTALYVDKEHADFYQNGDTLYVSVFASENAGTALVGFYGIDIYIDATGLDINSSQIVVTLFGDDTSDGSRCFLHVNSVYLVDSNKRCITLKQNLGGAPPRPGGGVPSNGKTALSKNGSAKSGIFDYEDEELQKDVRYFTDEEFANGAVTYWLNFKGKGYSGEYTGKWSQGKEYPIAATSPEKAFYRIDYEFVKAEESGLHVPPFANGGDEIEITYDERPLAIKIGGKSVAVGDKSTKLVYVANSKIEILYDLSDIEEVNAVNDVVSLSVDGRTVTVTGADSSAKRLFSTSGVLVAETDGNTVVAPKSGIFFLVVNGQSFKLSLK